LTPSRVLVTGANGQLGQAIVRMFSDREVFAHTRASLDISDSAAVRRVIADCSPHVVINAAAYNDVDGAEDAPLDAFAANAFGVRSLARAADTCGAVLVHYSTDFVFDGEQRSEPYDETSAPSPRSVYAASKLTGEWFAGEAVAAFVLRVESLFGVPAAWTGRRGTLDKMADALNAGREVPVFTDRVVSPAYIDDIAAATRHLVDSEAPRGLYHCVNTGQATWHEVAAEAARVLDVTPRFRLLSVDDVPMKAARPRYCALSNEKLRSAGFDMPRWQDAVTRWLAARQHPAV
jgi:dTDP-4-dehydrorhamnose reductase